MDSSFSAHHKLGSLLDRMHSRGARVQTAQEQWGGGTTAARCCSRHPACGLLVDKLDLLVAQVLCDKVRACTVAEKMEHVTHGRCSEEATSMPLGRRA